MILDKSIKWEITKLCKDYADYCKKNGDIPFVNYYFLGSEKKIIKKIYYREKYQKFIDFDELSYVAKKYSEYTKNINNHIYFDDWYNTNKITIDRYLKIKKIENSKEE